MNTASKADAASKPVAVRKTQKLQISLWMWKPWYAKLWWVSSAVYWTGFVLSFSVAPLRVLHETAFAGYLNVVFYPPVMLMLLGLGFVRAKIRRGDWIITPGDQGPHRFNRSVSGSLDPYTDPLDPKSGSLYIGSPEKLAELFGRKWP